MVLRVLMTGGSGTLGTELRKIADKNIYFLAPASSECDILNKNQLENTFKKFDFDLVLHCAAITNIPEIQKNPSTAINTNVIGTINILNECIENNKKMVFVSTDYVFGGQKGDYSIHDPINPLSKYAKTKAAAELVVRTYENSLVIRTSFYGHDFPYEKAFFDQWTSKDYVDVIAPKIIKPLYSDKRGIIHIGSKKRSVYEIAKQRKPNVKSVSRNSINFEIPHDTSFKEE